MDSDNRWPDYLLKVNCKKSDVASRHMTTKPLSPARKQRHFCPAPRSIHTVSRNFQVDLDFTNIYKFFVKAGILHTIFQFLDKKSIF